MPASEPGLGLASQLRRAWVASSQPVTWPLRASELAKLMLRVPGRDWPAAGVFAADRPQITRIR